MYILRFLDSFNPTYDTIVKGDQEKEKRTKKALASYDKSLFTLRLNHIRSIQEALERDGLAGLAEIYE